MAALRPSGRPAAASYVSTPGHHHGQLWPARSSSRQPQQDQKVPQQARLLLDLLTNAPYAVDCTTLDEVAPPGNAMQRHLLSVGTSMALLRLSVTPRRNEWGRPEVTSEWDSAPRRPTGGPRPRIRYVYHARASSGHRNTACTAFQHQRGGRAMPRHSHRSPSHPPPPPGPRVRVARHGRARPGAHVGGCKARRVGNPPRRRQAATAESGAPVSTRVPGRTHTRRGAADAGGRRRGGGGGGVATPAAFPPCRRVHNG